MLNIFEQIIKQINRSKSTLIVFSPNQDIESAAAALALFLFLKKTGKNVEIVSNSNFSNSVLKFLNGSNEVKNNIEHLRRFIVSLNISHTKVSQIKYVVENNQLNFIVSPKDGWFEASDVSSKAGEFRFDLIICLGINDLELLGDIYDKNIEFFYKTPIVNISCNPANEDFGQINLVDINFSTISEMVYKLIQTDKNNIIDENIATNLLAGIIIKTKNFKNPDLTPETLISASNLISLGAKRDEIINQLYRFKKLPDLKLWGKVLNSLKVSESGKIVWSVLNEEKEGDNSYHNLKTLNEELIINLPEAKIFIAFIVKNNNTSFYIFSLKNINLDKTIQDAIKNNNLNLRIIKQDNEWQIVSEENDPISTIIKALQINLDKIGL